MRGGQDLGSVHGLGPVEPEVDEPPFHDEWERRCFALTLAMGASGAWTLDQSRHARENRNPAQYMQMSYYEIWLAGLEDLLDQAGFVEKGELDGRARTRPVPAPAGVLQAGQVTAGLARGGPCDRVVDSEPEFAVGGRVRVRIMATRGHTRAPTYTHGHVGTIDRIHGGYVFPDTNARGAGEHPGILYSVRFDARDLFGDSAAPANRIFVDLWEAYLEAADQ